MTNPSPAQVQRQGATAYTVHEPRNGQAPKRTFLLGHALGCDHTMWDALTQHLAAENRVVCYDQFGHGSSDTPTGPYTMAQLADEAAAKAAATKAAAATGATPGTAAPVPTTAAPTTATPIAAPATTGASTASSAPATAYTTQLNSPHAVVLVFPKDSPAATGLKDQLATYNSRFFKANNLTVESSPLGADQELVVVKTLPWAKVAQSYATKLRGPQSPLARLHGTGYQTLVISLDNLTLLQATGDLTGYQSFYQKVFK